MLKELGRGYGYARAGAVVGGCEQAPAPALNEQVGHTASVGLARRRQATAEYCDARLAPEAMDILCLNLMLRLLHCTRIQQVRLLPLFQDLAISIRPLRTRSRRF